MRRFADRQQAGRLLAARVAALGLDDPVVVGLPRGGVAVAAEVAAALQAPLDGVVVRKLGLPSQPEVAMGAFGEDGVKAVNEDLVRRLAIPAETLDQVAERELDEVQRQIARYRGDRPGVPVRDRTVVLVDDGVATGSTIRAAIEVLRARGVSRVVVAVPVAPADLVPALRRLADDVVCLFAADDLVAVGAWFDDFHQHGDAEVMRLLGEPITREVQVPVGPVTLEGTVTVPPDPLGLVVFVHGSGSGRASPRNRAVASMLNRRGLATLLPDLLCEHEAERQASVIDVDPLASRLLSVLRWVRRQPNLAGLPLGLYGSSTAAAALCCEHHLEVVPGATHLFSEPGTLERVASLAADWFVNHLPSRATATANHGSPPA